MCPMVENMMKWAEAEGGEVPVTYYGLDLKLTLNMGHRGGISQGPGPMFWEGHIG